MREIKFRAWYEKEKRFLSWNELQDGTESLQTYFNNELSDVSPLMQYTGLKDKSGTEIYEGDIVQGLCPFTKKKSVGEVVFENGAFEIRTHESDFLDYEMVGERHDNVEVIGNIYENPELLEGEE